MSPISNSYHLKLGFSGDTHTGGPHPMGHAVYIADGSNFNTDTDSSQYLSDTFVVPNGVTYISAVCVGGGGGASASHNKRDLDGETFPNQYGAAHSSIPNNYAETGGGGGGGGGLAYGTFSVTPGETLTIRVGYGGTGGDLFKPQGLRAAAGSGQHGGDSKILRGATVLLEGGGGRAGIHNTYSTDADGGSGGSTGGTEREGGQTGGSGGDGEWWNEGGGGGGAGGYSYGSDPALHVGLGSGGSNNAGQNGDGFGSTFGGGSGGGYDRHNIYGAGNLIQAHSNGGGGVGVYHPYRDYNGTYDQTKNGGDGGHPGEGGSGRTPTSTLYDTSLGEYGGSSGYIYLGGRTAHETPPFHSNGDTIGWTTTRGGEGGQFGGGGGGATHYAHDDTITIGQTGGHGANGVVRIIFGGNPTAGVETGRSFPEYNTTFGSE
jgi:hypothetical protein|tara:strand:+ start:11277 stop:12572 length:1296 start_codon:yes stop_codon:yes gene_type:complete